jgi:hypothetical protein
MVECEKFERMANKLEIIEDANGTKRWLLNGQLHRSDGPAVEFADGRTRWFLSGKPAITPDAY